MITFPLFISMNNILNKFIFSYFLVDCIKKNWQNFTAKLFEKMASSYSLGKQSI